MKNITVFNIRSGFANNSSSTHSVIFFPPEFDTSQLKSESESEYGWNNFTLTSEDDKRKYLLATLKQNIHYDLSSDYFSAVLNTWCETSVSDDFIENTYVDHQSLMALPLTFDESAVNKKFFNEISKIILAPNVVILGGNDNDDEHPLSLEYSQYASSLDEICVVDDTKMIAKYDNTYDYWTLFNRFNGTKVRMVFAEQGTKNIIPSKANTPDLVDIKITDYCTFNCSFCYQGSTKNGQHADKVELKNIINVLASNELFEIAYGGGEPTQHPDFIEILKFTKERHIIPNFTTKNLKWIKEHLGEIKDVIGSFAYSVSHLTQIKELAVIRDFYEVANHKVAVQLVMGAQSMQTALGIIEECAKYRMPITLLGFKEQERGIGFKKQPYDNWLTEIKTLNESKGLYLKLGVDTALIQQSEDQLKDARIPEFMYHKDEGMFSWYVDAVAKKMGPSSYAPTAEYKHFYSEFYPTYSAFVA